MFKRTFLVVALGLVSTAAFAKAVPYDIDANHTQVQFSYSHFGFSDITDRFMQVTGEFNLDTDDLSKSSITVNIPIDGVSTGVPKLDAHLKSPDFFDAVKFPTATFKSTKVEIAGTGKLKVSGDLTIHGVTKPVLLDVTVNKLGENPMSKVPSAGFDASVTLLRSDFGMANYVPVVSDQVKLQITMEAHQAAKQ
jgi:polyisoprenoid-binding protein YceI